MAAAAVTSAAPYLALLEEDDATLQRHALKQLDSVVPQFWYQISKYIPQVEALCEDSDFDHREQASLLVSKVFYYLRELDEALNYALGAGAAFDVNEKSEYVSTIIARALDKYFELRQASDHAAGGSAQAPSADVDPRLEAVVERMITRCCSDKQWHQALGICVEARRLQKLEEVARASDDLCAALRHVLKASQVIVSRHVRDDVLKLIVRIFGELDGLAPQDRVLQCQSLMTLEQPEQVAEILSKLVESGDEKSYLLALQIAFDLFDNDVYAFMQRVGTKLSELRSASAAGTAENGEASAPSGTSSDLAKRYDATAAVIAGTWPIRLSLEFLYWHNATDLLLLKNIKDSFDTRVSMNHSATVMANAYMHAGTTVDTFLRNNLEWLGAATNWAKFGATASLGVIHRGHLNNTVELMAPYLPSEGRTVSPYSEGGALYALGIIHAGHGQSITEFLSKSLRESNHEVVQHGACLGLGLAAQGTDDDAIYDSLKDVLYMDSAVSGEAAGLAMGLLCCGAPEDGTDRRAAEMLAYARETAHEKIIRGVAMGLAMACYGREEAADGMIEQLTRDSDRVLRYGGMFALGMAYRGTDSNAAVKQLLHHAVSDVDDDVRRAAVLSLGFVLLGVPEQCPAIVRLLAESYNPHLRYGAAMAVGVACAGTGLKAARSLLEPMLKDSTDFVRQGAAIATALVLLQQPEADGVSDFRKHLESTIGDKHEDNVCKMGAIMASGILDAGGRNVTVGVVSATGTFRRTSIVAMALFLQYWYWFPYAYILPLSFKCTAVIGVTRDLKLPKFTLTCNCKKGTFAYAKPVADNAKKKVSKLPTAVLSTTKKAKERAKKKDEAKAGKPGAAASMDIDSPKAVKPDAKAAENGKSGDVKASAGGKDGVGSKDVKDDTDKEKKDAEKAKEEEEKAENAKCPFTMENPVRVVPSQAQYVSFNEGARFQPVKPFAAAGVLVLVDTKPNEPVEYVEKQSMAAAEPAPAANSAAGAAAAPASGAAGSGGAAEPAARREEPDAPDDMEIE